MKIAITTDGKNITTFKDYGNIKDRSEISHYLAELEIIKYDLLERWETYDE